MIKINSGRPWPECVEGCEAIRTAGEEECQNLCRHKFQDVADIAEQKRKETDAIRLISSEYYSAVQGHPLKFNSFHEGIAVIREEFEELWEEIRKRRDERDAAKILEEARQLGAMAMRFIVDLCEVKGDM